MSSVFDVPQQLVLAISLATAPIGSDQSPGVHASNLPKALSRAYALKGAGQDRHGKPFAVGTSAAGARGVGTSADFRFSETAWLRAVKDAARLPGMGAISGRIFKTSSGRHYVPIAAERRDILALRRRPEIAFRIAADHAARNILTFTPLIGRTPNSGELYIAHLLGAQSAARLVRTAERQPGAPAAASAGLAAAAFEHPDLFFAGRRARSAGEIYRKLTRPFGSSSTPHSPARGIGNAGGAAIARKVAALAMLDWTPDVQASQ